MLVVTAACCHVVAYATGLQVSTLAGVMVGVGVLNVWELASCIMPTIARGVISSHIHGYLYVPCVCNSCSRCVRRWVVASYYWMS